MGSTLTVAREVRTVDVSDARVEQRSDTAVTFRGHAAVFNVQTQIGPAKWGFREQIAPGAFAKSITESDVRFLKNHDPNLILSRSSAGDLRLSEDSVGLVVDADIDTRKSYAKDFALDLELRHITQMSFAFEVVREDREDLPDGTELRTILEARLWDVSAVVYPAYDETDAALRAGGLDWLMVRMGLSTTKRSRLLAGLAHDPDDPEARAILRGARDRLSSLVDGSAPATATPNPDEGVPAPATATRGVPLAVTRRRHELLASRHELPITNERTP